jgi:N-acetylgalactosamine kinase
MDNLNLSDKILILDYNQKNLEFIYNEDFIHKERYDNLISRFEELYSSKPKIIARAPGRVNIIGEHIDYAGFAVLPMAILNDILIAIEIEDNDSNMIEFEINHYNSNMKSYNISVKEEEMLDFVKPHDWINYVIAGFNSITSFAQNNNITINRGKRIRLLVTGNIPFASGLSSSSALTVVSALVMSVVYNINDCITKAKLAETTINYERSVGTACGGMDQTISVFAEKGSAKLIEFSPKLNLHSVNLPNNVSFIIANSRTDSPKIDTLALRYNKRVVENKLGIAILCKQKGIENLPILYDLKDRLKLNYIDLANLISNGLKDIYSLQQIIEEFDDIDSILKDVPFYKEVLDKNTEFNLKNRLLHVSKEAERVESFFAFCQESIPDIIKLGELMNQSHSSCKDLYECSSLELDKLVKFSISNGALGARLTGAGWGGCSVILIENNKVNDFMNLMNNYYHDNFNIENSDDFFVTKPSQGALLFKLI